MMMVDFPTVLRAPLGAHLVTKSDFEVCGDSDMESFLGPT